MNAITAYLIGGKDAHKNWEPSRPENRHGNKDLIAPLIYSCYEKDIPIIIINDCFDVKSLTGQNSEELPIDFWLKVEPDNKISANARRWKLFLTQVKIWQNPGNYSIFLLDSTDVECYIKPDENIIGDFLWTGDERLNTVGSTWMKKHQEPYITMSDYKEVLAPYRNHTLLNCGIIGGKREIVLEYLEYVVKYQSECNLPDNISVDMAVHNYVLFKHFKGRFKHGVQVNTVFWKNEKPNGVSWFRHK